MLKGFKRYISILILGLLLIIVVASGLETDDELLAPEIEEDETDLSLTVIGFSQPGAESAWRVALTESVSKAFTEKNGYRLIYKDGQNKQDNQIRDIRTFIQQGVDYIILSPIVETGWDSVLEEAKSAGIPVIICDRNVTVSNESLYTAFVGSNFRKQGDVAASYIEQLAEEKTDEEKLDGTIEKDYEYLDIEGNPVIDSNFNIVHIQGTIGSTAQKGRTDALAAALAKHDDWKIISQEDGEFTKAKAREIVTNLLLKCNPNDIDLIYCENDEEALGAIAALNEAGISYGIDGDIAIISFDATENGLTMCLGGHINLDVECNPLQGSYLLNIVEMLKEGRTVPKTTYVDEEYFTQDDLSADFIEAREY